MGPIQVTTVVNFFSVFVWDIAFYSGGDFAVPGNIALATCRNDVHGPIQTAIEGDIARDLVDVQLLHAVQVPKINIRNKARVRILI